jgi:hypothetical protein
MSKPTYRVATLEAPQREDGAAQGEWEEYHKKLLSVAERYGTTVASLKRSFVLHYSLVQSRQRHIEQLFPHILTHPALTSQQRPKAEKKRSILDQDPIIPLPFLEYHKGKEGDPVPAHETRCIARVTVRVGPAVYTETELWVGRFVDQETYVKPERVRPQREKKVAPRPRPSVPKAAATPVPVVSMSKPPGPLPFPQRPPLLLPRLSIRPPVRPTPGRPAKSEVVSHSNLCH